MKYALIKDNIVANVIVLNLSNAYEFSSAISTGGLPVMIGDTYENGKFYRDGAEVRIGPELTELGVGYKDELTDDMAALETLGYTEESNG